MSQRYTRRSRFDQPRVGFNKQSKLRQSFDWSLWWTGFLVGMGIGLLLSVSVLIGVLLYA